MFLVLTLLLYVGVSITVTIVYAGLHHQDGDVTTEDDWRESAMAMLHEPAALATLAMAAQVTFLAVTVCAAWLSPMGIIRRLRLGPSGLSWAGYLTLPFGILSINFLFEAAIKLLHVEQEGGNLDLIHNVITQVSPAFLVVMVLVIGVMPGFAEEFLFRGYVQSRLSVRWGRGLAIFVAAALFGLFHFDRIQSPATFLMGLYLGYVAERSGSIRPAMFAHMFNNSAVVIFSWWFARMAGEEAAVAAPVNPRAELLTAAGCLVLFALCCLYLKYRVHPPEQPQAEMPSSGGFPISNPIATA